VSLRKDEREGEEGKREGRAALHLAIWQEGEEEKRGRPAHANSPSGEGRGTKVVKKKDVYRREKRKKRGGGLMSIANRRKKREAP